MLNEEEITQTNKCKECNDREVTCECLECGALVCEECYDFSHAYAKCAYLTNKP